MSWKCVILGIYPPSSPTVFFGEDDARGLPPLYDRILSDTFLTSRAGTYVGQKLLPAAPNSPTCALYLTVA